MSRAPVDLTPRWPRWALALLAVYAALGVVYSIATPIFEPPDEVFHFPVIDHIATTGRLPYQDPDDPGPWEQEGSQPPLYYLLSAPLVLPIDRADLESHLERNPHARIGIGAATDNHVSVLHDWDAEAFPWRGTPLAVHVVRLFSLALGVGTLLAIYQIARLAVPGRPWVQATALLLAAFNPMFLFISASVNNDTLINLLGAWALVVLLLIWRGGLTRRRTWSLAILLALAALTKLSGLTLYAVAAVVVVLAQWRARRPWRELIAPALIVLGAWAVIAGWWYARNLDLYGDPTGLNVMVQIIQPREHTPGWRELADEFEGLRRSTWGVFGTLNVSAPDALFWYGDALSALALLGLLVYAVRQARALRPQGDRAAWLERARDPLAVAILALHALVVFAALINWTRRTPATQGRLMFPTLGALATLAGLGLASLLPRRWERALPLAAAPLMIAAAALPFTVIAPTYAPPPTVDAIPPDATPIDARFGPIEVLGLRVDPAPVAPGASLDVTFYWRPLEHTAEDMSFYAQVFGRALPGAPDAFAEIGKLDSYPGGGLLRTTTWGLDTIYADRYQIPIDPDAEGPVQPAIKIGWRRFGSGEEFAPVTRDGSPRDAVIVRAGRIVGDGATLPDGAPVDAVFSGIMRLNAARVTPAEAAPGDAIAVTLEWEALVPVNEDFAVLVHLIDPAAPDEPLAQADSAPLDGQWPTSAWSPEQPFLDPHTLRLPDDLPPGEYALAVGFYRPADFTRLPVETERATLPGAVVLPQPITIR